MLTAPGSALNPFPVLWSFNSANPITVINISADNLTSPWPRVGCFFFIYWAHWAWFHSCALYALLTRGDLMFHKGKCPPRRWTGLGFSVIFGLELPRVALSSEQFFYRVKGMSLHLMLWTVIIITSNIAVFTTSPSSSLTHKVLPLQPALNHLTISLVFQGQWFLCHTY